AQQFGCVRISTRVLIAERFSRSIGTREEEQKAGEILDKRTKGAWLAQALARRRAGQNNDEVWIVDSVRIIEQIDELRRAFGSRVLHLHLTAPIGERARRFKRRKRRVGEATT